MSKTEKNKPKEDEHRFELFRRLEELKNKPVTNDKKKPILVGDKVFKSEGDRAEWIRARIKLMGLVPYLKSITKNTKRYGKLKRKKVSSKKGSTKKESSTKKETSSKTVKENKPAKKRVSQKRTGKGST